LLAIDLTAEWRKTNSEIGWRVQSAGSRSSPSPCQESECTAEEGLKARFVLTMLSAVPQRGGADGDGGFGETPRARYLPSYARFWSEKRRRSTVNRNVKRSQAC
jgi:hypothetical protein